MSKLNIVMYHYVRDLQNSRYKDIKGLDYTLFKRQIEYFEHHFRVITMEDVLAFYEEGQAIPENALLLTFDDGYIDHYEYVFPILKEHKVQGSFFSPAKSFMENKLLDVNKIHFILASASIEELCQELMQQMDYYRGREFDYPSNKELFDEYAIENRFDARETIFFKRILQTVLPEELRKIISSKIFSKYVGVSEEVMARELYMNRDQMKFMKREGMYFGIHGYDHYWMNKLPPKQLEQDIDKALECLDGIVDVNRWVINYPYGSYSDQVIQCVSNKGCLLGLSTDVRCAVLEKDNRYILPRLDTNDYPPKSENYKRY